MAALYAAAARYVVAKTAVIVAVVHVRPSAECLALTSVGDAASVIVYDNTAQSGTILCKLAVAAAATAASANNATTA